MAKGDELKGFLKAQRAKAEARDRSRREDAVRRDIEQRNRQRAALMNALGTIPDEVKEYAKLNADFEPFMIALNIPGCHPIWLTTESGGMVATVYPPINTALPVPAVPSFSFPLRAVVDLTDAIAASVIEDGQANR